MLLLEICLFLELGDFEALLIPGAPAYSMVEITLPQTHLLTGLDIIPGHELGILRTCEAHNSGNYQKMSTTSLTFL